jgi:endonuclease/exonuclease/phosphatase family metal-dependent hydrolase
MILYFLRYLIILIFLFGCDDSQMSPDPCDEITCSGFGTCVQDDTGTLSCECDNGYHSQGFECIPINIPVFTTTPDTLAWEDSTYLYTIECMDAQDDQLTLAIDSADTCDGNLVDDGTGNGTYTFFPGVDLIGGNCVLSLACIDNNGETGHQTVNIDINESGNASLIGNLPSDATTNWGRGGSFQVETNEEFPLGELNWKVDSSNCTFNSTIDSSALVTWVCKDVETCSIKVRAIDKTSGTSWDTQLLNVSCTNSPPEIISEVPDSAIEGMHYRYAVSCPDPEGDIVIITVDASTDTCGGSIAGNIYSYETDTLMVGTSCSVGIKCTDTQSEVTQDSTTEVLPFSGSIDIRIVAANVSSENFQNYDPGHGIRILQALLPDIVLVQEMSYLSNSDANYKTFSNLIVGTDYYSLDSAGFEIPNGVISKWPILSSGYWDDPSLTNRELFWAVVDLPGDVDLFVISVHLHTSPNSDQVAAAGVIVDKVKTHKLIYPGKFYYVVGGDFNGTASVSTSGFGMDGTFSINDPFPEDDNGNSNTNAPRSSHYDFILTDSTMSSFQVPVVFESNVAGPQRTYVDGFVFDTRTFTQSLLNNYFSPALVSDSDAPSMQHMAVVKDYFLD